MKFENIQKICDSENISISIEYIYDELADYYRSRNNPISYNRYLIGFAITSFDRYNDNIKYKIKVFQRDINETDFDILIDSIRIDRLNDKILGIKTNKENVLLMQWLNMYKQYYDIYNSGQEIYEGFIKWAGSEVDVNKLYESYKKEVEDKIETPIKDINKEIDNIIKKYSKDVLNSLRYEFSVI